MQTNSMSLLQTEWGHRPLVNIIIDVHDATVTFDTYLGRQLVSTMISLPAIAAGNIDIVTKLFRYWWTISLRSGVGSRTLLVFGSSLLTTFLHFNTGVFEGHSSIFARSCSCQMVFLQTQKTFLVYWWRWFTFSLILPNKPALIHIRLKRKLFLIHDFKFYFYQAR